MQTQTPSQILYHLVEKSFKEGNLAEMELDQLSNLSTQCLKGSSQIQLANRGLLLLRSLPVLFRLCETQHLWVQGAGIREWMNENCKC